MFKRTIAIVALIASTTPAVAQTYYNNPITTYPNANDARQEFERAQQRQQFHDWQMQQSQPGHGYGLPGAIGCYLPNGRPC